MNFVYEIVLLFSGSIVAGTVVYISMSRGRRELASRMKQAHLETVEAAALLQRHGRLANEVAHELKNPITAIACAADTLEFLLGDRLDEWEGKTLRHIKDNGDYVMKLMADFIDLSKGTTGQLVSNKQAVPVSDVVRSVVGLLEPSAGQKAIAIDVIQVEDSVYMNVDPKHLKQILFNLIYNAIKFTPRGGAITVSFGIGPDSECVSLEVVDNGEGIAEGSIDTLFDPLQHIHSKEGECGNGLGLPLTKALVELEGGDISVRSAKGKGTTFRLILPRAFRASAGEKSIESVLNISGARPLSGESVLIVDANPVTREALQRVIAKLGAAVDGVAEAVDALEAIHTTQYTTVVMDEAINPLHAHEIAQLVRRDRAEGSGRVFVAGVKPNEEKKCEVLGVDGHIEKTLRPEAILDILMR